MYDENLQPTDPNQLDAELRQNIAADLNEEATEAREEAADLQAQADALQAQADDLTEQAEVKEAIADDLTEELETAQVVEDAQGPLGAEGALGAEGELGQDELPVFGSTELPDDDAPEAEVMAEDSDAKPEPENDQE